VEARKQGELNKVACML